MAAIRRSKWPRRGVDATQHASLAVDRIENGRLLNAVLATAAVVVVAAAASASASAAAAAAAASRQELGRRSPVVFVSGWHTSVATGERFGQRKGRQLHSAAGRQSGGLELREAPVGGQGPAMDVMANMGREIGVAARD